MCPSVVLRQGSVGVYDCRLGAYASGMWGGPEDDAAYSSSSLLGIQAAIEAGLGISALAQSTVPQGLHSHLKIENSPQLGHVKLVFKHDRSNQTDATKRLYEYLYTGLEQSSS